MIFKRNNIFDIISYFQNPSIYICMFFIDIYLYIYMCIHFRISNWKVDLNRNLREIFIIILFYDLLGI